MMRVPALLSTCVFMLGCQVEGAGTAPPTGGGGAVQVIALKDLNDRYKSARVQVVGRTFRVEGKLKSIAMAGTPVGPDKGVQVGQLAEGTPGAVYAVPFEAGGVTGVCYVDEQQQKQLLADFNGAESIAITVEGAVEPTFGHLAPCKVVDKKIARK
jgi:hypothetical protein